MSKSKYILVTRWLNDWANWTPTNEIVKLWSLHSTLQQMEDLSDLHAHAHADTDMCRNVSYVPWCTLAISCMVTPVSLSQGTGIAQWLECQARGQKAAGVNPCRSGGRIFSRVNFLCWLLFQYLFHPRVTAVARKRPRSFWQKCRLQLNSHAPYVCGFAWSDMVHGIHRMRRDGRSFMWHQPCQSCKYTTLVDIQKRTIKKLFTHVESHPSAASLLKSGE